MIPAEVQPQEAPSTKRAYPASMAPYGVVVALFALLVTGCTTMGPANIPRDRFDYAAAISDSWKNPMLLGS